MRLAHYSDLHVTHFPLTGRLALKRVAAVMSYSVMGRGAHFAGSDARIASLLNDVDEQKVDHSLCTGDLTGVATEAEMARIAEVFGARLHQPERVTVIPGNHDRYVASAAGVFEKHFGALCDNAHFPLVKSLPSGVTLVCIDSARPTNVVDSSGLVGQRQRDALTQILTDASLQHRFVVLGLHYGLLRMHGGRDSPSHGLRDDLEVLALIDRPDVHLDLVVHGHLHRSFRLRTQRRHIVNAGSATDLHSPGAGYNVYDIDPHAHRVQVSRRVWSVENQRYVPAPDASVSGEFFTR